MEYFALQLFATIRVYYVSYTCVDSYYFIYDAMRKTYYRASLA